MYLDALRVQFVLRMRNKAGLLTSVLLHTVILLGGVISLVVILGVCESVFKQMAKASGGASQPVAAASAAAASPVAAGSKLVSVEFEVHGKVQGVYFRKHTKQNAEKRQLTGWVRNTMYGTVVGVLEGPASNVAQMKQWLRTRGSPKSRIDRCSFRNEKQIGLGHQRQFKAFNIQN